MSKAKRMKNNNRNEVNKKALDKFKKQKELEQKNREKQIKKLEKKKREEQKKRIRELPKNVEKRRRRAKFARNISAVFIIIIAIVLFINSPVFYIKTTNIEGNSAVTKEQILNMLDIGSTTNIFEVTNVKINRKLKKNPYIESAEVKYKLPSTLNITITERNIDYLVENNGTYVCVDKNGNILQLSTEKMEGKISLIGCKTSTESLIVGNRLCDIDINRLKDVNILLDYAKSNEIDNTISSIDISDDANYIAFSESENKKIHFGDTKDLDLKMKYVKKIMEVEKGNSGEIFVNMNLNEENPFFRESV